MASIMTLLIPHKNMYRDCKKNMTETYVNADMGGAGKKEPLDVDVTGEIRI
jgi:hypothetical protein